MFAATDAWREEDQDLRARWRDDRRGKARFLITELNSQLWLPRLAFTIKVKLVNALLSGSTDDDDEDAINLVLQTAQAYDQAELYQLTAAARWDSLYSSMNGDEYDTMETTLNNLA